MMHALLVTVHWGEVVQGVSDVIFLCVDAVHTVEIVYARM